MAQPIRITQALRVSSQSRLAIVGAGGKTTLMIRLARELAAPVVLTTSTHLSADQAGLADRHYMVGAAAEIEDVFRNGVRGSVLFTGALTAENRLDSLPSDLLECVRLQAEQAHLPIFIEADGSRRLPLKAPAEHEPAIPAWVNQVVVVAGMSGLGQALTSESVHRPERFAELAGQKVAEPVTLAGLAAVLLSPQGGLKNIPLDAQKYLVLNQADGDELQASAGRLAQRVLRENTEIHRTGKAEDLNFYDAVLVVQLQDVLIPVKAVYSPVAAVVLAAGKSSRMGRSAKVLLEWRGEAFVHKAARTALEAGLAPVVVVTGARARSVKKAVADLDVRLVENKQWADGQSTSLISGLKALPPDCAGVIFLLADQPQVTPEVLRALVDLHRGTLAPIIAPMVEDRRANPVLFDRVTFPALLELTGDTGGRAVFARFTPQWLPWLDPLLLLDVDTPDDLKELSAAYESQFDPSSAHE